MFIDIRNLQERRQTRDSQFEDTRDIRNGYLFEVNGSVEGDRDGLVWFKALDDNSQPFQVFYGGVIGDIRANMFVKIERDPKDPARWQVIEFDTGIYFNDQSTYEQLPSLSAIPAKEDYEWPPGFPGAKALNIFPRAITDFAVRPTSPASMKARVYSGIYPGATNYARFQGPVNTKDFTADVPGAGLARLAAISIDNTGTLNYTNGTTFVDGLPMPDASLPAVPASQMLISAIRLVNGMTAIEESNFDLEMRPLMANGTVNVKVSEIWESDFGAVALQADASGKIGIPNAAPSVELDVTGTITADKDHASGTRVIVVNNDDDTDNFADVIVRTHITADNQGFAMQVFPDATNFTGPDGMSMAGWARFRTDANVNGFVLNAAKTTGQIIFAVNTLETARIKAGIFFVNDDTNTFMTKGITINQEGNDDEAFALKDITDVAHGMTTLTETDTYATSKKAVAASGGLGVFGYSEDTQAISSFARATNDDTTKSTAAVGAFMVSSQKKSGTSVGAMGADANLVVFRNSGTARFIFDAEGSGHADVAWVTFSDRRLKADIADLTYGLNEVMKLRPRSFKKSNNRQHIGLIAQEVMNIIPESVKPIDEETSFYSLDYDSLIALLISAIQELNRKVEDYGVN